MANQQWKIGVVTGEASASRLAQHRGGRSGAGNRPSSVVGFASGSWRRPRPAHLVNRNYSVIGVMPSGYDRAFKEDAQAFLLEHWRAGRLRTAVHQVVPFEQLPDAVELVAGGRVLGKLAVQ